ncbi:capsular polysaccharide synthesis protein [Acinetobacter sp. ANC 3882]|uniref:glycosyltransferase family 32 protein n=1 Tax=Acinetobacter sp. ANC 3882 TaxID=2923423 RepID=UPI001F4B21D2|nr:capsular polysaccharide synthesis protein [Acinetobacter sp. ANC 3882]MCH7314653.1 capsular polysaccharide synthesis protein [Acinetobacter sp. ANC 3882]
MKIFKKIFYILKFYTMYSNKKRDMNEAIENYADVIVLNPQSENAAIPKIIWMYWEGALPKFVEKCVENIRTKNPDYQVNFLNPETVKSFCDIDYSRLQHATPQQKADLIRFELIYQYGGIWLDASTIVYENLDWIQELIERHNTNSFAYYRAKNTTQLDFPVLENWLLASTEKNIFFKYWFDELAQAVAMSPKAYIQQIRQTEPHYQELFQEIGRLEYLVAYVACQKVMRHHLPSMTLINCDKNAFFYQVKNKWMKERVLIDLAINHSPAEKPKLIKLAGKERNILSHYYVKGMYFKDSLIDI